MSNISREFSNFLDGLSDKEDPDRAACDLAWALIEEKSEKPWLQACDETMNRIRFGKAPESLKANYIEVLTLLLLQVGNEKFHFRSDGGRFAKGVLVSLDAASSMKEYQDDVYMEVGSLFYGSDMYGESVLQDVSDKTAVTNAMIGAADPGKEDQGGYSYMLHHFSENFRSGVMNADEIRLTGEEKGNLLKKIVGFQESIQDVASFVKQGNAGELKNRTDIIADLTQLIPV